MFVSLTDVCHGEYCFVVVQKRLRLCVLENDEERDAVGLCDKNFLVTRSRMNLQASAVWRRLKYLNATLLHHEMETLYLLVKWFCPQTT